MRVALALLGAALAFSGCTGDGADAGDDAGKPACVSRPPTRGVPTILPGVFEGGRFVPLADGGALPLVTPPQGGHVSFVGARIGGLDTCGVSLKATLRSVATNLIAAEEERTVDFDFDVDDAGLSGADPAEIANAANVPACPDYADESIVNVPHTLTVRALDRAGASASVTIAVEPSCTQSSDDERASCLCECSGGYTLGRCSNPVVDGWLDGGPPRDGAGGADAGAN